MHATFFIPDHRKLLVQQNSEKKVLSELVIVGNLFNLLCPFGYLAKVVAVFDVSKGLTTL